MGKKATDQATIAWQNVDKLEERNNYSKVLCKHCDHSFSGGVSRIVSHLLGTGSGVKACSKCPEDVKTRLSAAKASTDASKIAKRKREEEVEAIKTRNVDKEAAAASGSCSSAAAAASGQGSNDKTEQRAIVRAFKRAKRSAADKAIMKFFACEGIPFNKARGPWWREMISAVAAAGPGYVPPAYNAMRTTLLDNLKSTTESELLLFDMRSKDTMVGVKMDLVYVFSNQRLLRKLNSGTHQEEFVPWDSEDEQEEDAAAGSDGDEEEEQGVEIVE